MEKTKILNTTYLVNKEVLIIRCNSNGEFILTSLSQDKQYNIDGLFSYLKDRLKAYNCKFIESDGYIYDNGLGISEKLHHNSVTKSMKKVVVNNILKSKSYIRNLW